MRDKIKRAILDVLEELKIGGMEVEIDSPKDPSFGDYTSNIALKTKLNPSELVQKLGKIKGIGKIEAVGGFINFRISQEYLQNQVLEIIKADKNYGSSNLGKHKRASVEFISANPTGPLHIGNARGGPIGDVLSNVLSFAGFEVTREYLHNDVGGQVKKLGLSIYFKLNPDKTPEEELMYQGSYIESLALKVAEIDRKSFPKKPFEQLPYDEASERLGKIAVEILFEQIIRDAEAMGIKFDKVTKESDLRKKVPEVLKSIKKSLKEKNGALWFAPSDEFLKDRETVVQKSDKEYTYFASDIVYHKLKMGSNDLVVDVLGGNHAGHVPRLEAAINALGFDVSKFKVILYQYVRIKSRDLALKMSKRQGTFITAKEVLDEVGRDAFRFFLLTSGPDTHMDFDLELAKKRANDNPVYYVQYAYSRIHGVFKKVKETGSTGSESVELLKEKEEIELMRHLIKFPELLENIASSFSVHLLTAYAYETANLFHKLYEMHQIVSKDKEKTKARLALASATKIVLRNTLTILGVDAPERM